MPTTTFVSVAKLFNSIGFEAFYTFTIRSAYTLFKGARIYI